MAKILKLLSPEITLGNSANTVNNGRCVRILNASNNYVLLTQSNSSANIATITLSSNTESIIDKKSSDNLQTNTTSGVLAVSIAFRD